MKILYVEDSPSDADLTQATLATNAPDFVLDIVTTHKAALECLAQPDAGYDVVMTDIHLPDGDGLSLLTRIRERGLQVAVVIITGGGDEHTAVAALKAGANDYVVKRSDYLSVLPQTLKSACERYRAEVARHSRPLQVLYAEDNSADANLTLRHLGRHARHIQVHVVYSAAAVMERLPRQGPVVDCDVLLLDYRLPGKNAPDLLREILQVRRLDLPVVIVTGQGDEELALQVLRMGAADYVVKNPGYLFQLPSVLENAFHRAQMVREQAALRQSEARYRSLVEQLPAITYMVALDGQATLLYVSPQVQAMLGLPPAEYIANQSLWQRHLHPEDRERVLALLRRPPDDGEPLRSECRLVRTDGRLMWMRNEAVLVRSAAGQPLFLQGIMLDITDHRQAAAMLRESNETLAALIDASPLAVTALDAQGQATMWNLAAERLFGWQAAEVLGERLPIVPPDGWADFDAMLAAAWKGIRRTGQELRQLCKNGQSVDVSLWTAPLRDAHGSITGVMALYADIGDRKRAEAQIAYQANLLSNIHDAVIATNAQFELTAWNRAAENLYGWQTEEVLGRPVGDVLRSSMTAEQRAASIRSLEQIGHYRMEIVQFRRDGRPVPVEGTTIALHDEAGRVTGYVSVNRDISDRKQAEVDRERLHSQVATANKRLQALSQRLLDVQEAERRHLARELHDEIGQQLTGLKLLLEMNASPPDLPPRSSLSEAQGLLQDLMSRVRELSLSLRPAMLDDLGLLPALLWHLERYTIQTGVQVKFQHNGIESQRFASTIETAAYRIVQEALTNVARHARASDVRVQLWCEAGMLHLEVADNGPGFDAQSAQTAYRSSGLAGMSERATLLGGHFRIESAAGAGTRLAAQLPVAENGADGAH